MTRTRIPLIAALALSAAALGAHAQDIQTPAAAAPPGPASGAPSSLQQVDRNSDGKVTKAEAAGNAELARRFGELDVDNSGKLDSGEFARFEIGDEPPPASPSPY
jgi:EF hand